MDEQLRRQAEAVLPGHLLVVGRGQVLRLPRHAGIYDEAAAGTAYRPGYNKSLRTVTDSLQTCCYTCPCHLSLRHTHLLSLSSFLPGDQQRRGWLVQWWILSAGVAGLMKKLIQKQVRFFCAFFLFLLLGGHLAMVSSPILLI